MQNDFAGSWRAKAAVVLALLAIGFMVANLVANGSARTGLTLTQMVLSGVAAIAGAVVLLPATPRAASEGADTVIDLRAPAPRVVDEAASYARTIREHALS